MSSLIFQVSSDRTLGPECGIPDESRTGPHLEFTLLCPQNGLKKKKVCLNFSLESLLKAIVANVMLVCCWHVCVKFCIYVITNSACSRFLCWITVTSADVGCSFSDHKDVMYVISSHCVPPLYNSWTDSPQITPESICKQTDTLDLKRTRFLSFVSEPEFR